MPTDPMSSEAAPTEATSTQTASPEATPFRAEIGELLDILIHSLYQDREVFLRELVSNAADALHRVRLELLRSDAAVTDPEVELAIWLEPDQTAGTLSVHDSGVGMSEAELREYLGTIARSSAREVLSALKDGDPAAAVSVQDVIGRFGVGFYSAFMVASSVRVVSRSADPEAQAAFWRSSGEDGFEIGPATRAGRGTTVEITLKPDAAEFAEPARLRDIVKRHSDFIPFPIYLKTPSGTEKLNQQTAPWRERPQAVSAEQHAEFYRQLTLDDAPPARTLHVVTDSPIQLYAMLYLPAKRPPYWRMNEPGLALYARKVLIAPRFKELLPPYLRFVEGVVDAEDLPLNVSRETVQATPLLARLRKVLTGRVVSELTRFAREDAPGFEAFFREFGAFLKEGVATDPQATAPFVELLRFPSTKDAGVLTSLADYAARMAESQQDIYYALGDDPDALQTSGRLAPFLERGLEVLLLTDPMDSFLLMGLTSYQNHALRSVDEADLALTSSAPPLAGPDEAAISLAAYAKRLLSAHTADVRLSTVMAGGDARLLTLDEGVPASWYRAQRLMGREAPPPPRLLELNPKSPLVRSLAARHAADPNDPLLGVALAQLLDNELLAEGLHPNPAQMLPRLQTLLAAAVGQGEPQAE